MSDSAGSCPHCGSRLKKWRVPEGATWDAEHFWVCFDDECSFYKEGWTWMMEQYSQQASYRYMFNPTTGSSSQIPVSPHPWPKAPICRPQGLLVGTQGELESRVKSPTPR